MSTRDDATLSAQERAAFAKIQAQALADDPRLGASPGARVLLRVKQVLPAAAHLAGTVWFGPVVVAVGVVLIVAGLATELALAVFGLAVLLGGAVAVAGTVRRHWEAPAAGTAGPPPAR